MTTYKAPVRDFKFLFNEVLDMPAHYKQLDNGSEATPDMIDAILEGIAAINEDVIAPLNISGDHEGCQFKDGVVTTPKGFKDAYKQYSQGGWTGLSFPEEFGGQNLPTSLNLINIEITGTANWSFQMYPGLSTGCINTILEYGTDEQKKQYLPSLVSGQWSGTMCLTEPQCGTDLAQVKTKAEPQKDGSFKLTGTKIFISAGEHDLTENIVHIVLARLPNSPKGTKGISLFIVPKFNVDKEGKIGERNPVNCGSIEHKMGIRGSSTAVLNFDAATGYMISEENNGLEAMFTFMNSARIGTAIQGVCHAEASFQGALEYAKERRSMRSLSGKKDLDHEADALIWHADIRRMLLTQKAIAEGGRAMIFNAAKVADLLFCANSGSDKQKQKELDDNLGFYTPILKGFLTELGLEAANHGVQIFGGHGYIQEHGMEQIVRDARIATLYEGTTGIQALDLLGRKVMIATKGKCIRDFTSIMMSFAKGKLFKSGPVGKISRSLLKRAIEWNILTTRLMLRAKSNPDVVGAASTDFLMYSGYLMMAYIWALQADTAQRLLDSGEGSESKGFYQAKIETAEFYFARLLPRADMHKKGALAKPETLMNMQAENFHHL